MVHQTIIDSTTAALFRRLSPSQRSLLSFRDFPGSAGRHQLELTAWPGRFISSGTDPWIDVELNLPTSEIRYLVLGLACTGETPTTTAQVFWTSDLNGSYDERRSRRVTVIADGRERLYVIDLRVENGRMDRNWVDARRLSKLRVDPLDCPGTVTMLDIVAYPEEAFDCVSARNILNLPPVRQELADLYLHGQGVEIGALQNPLQLPATSRIRYIDRLTRAEARITYSELGDAPLVDPEIIADAETLHAVPDATVDFCVANHVLEHMRNPLKALENWIRIIRPGGHLYLAVPDIENPLDKGRQLTSLEHLIADYQLPQSNRLNEDREHFSEWTEFVHRHLSASARAEYAKQLQVEGYAIHFHTFSAETARVFFTHACSVFGTSLVEFRSVSKTDGAEHIAVVAR